MPRLRRAMQSGWSTAVCSTSTALVVVCSVTAQRSLDWFCIIIDTKLWFVHFLHVLLATDVRECGCSRSHSLVTCSTLCLAVEILILTIVLFYKFSFTLLATEFTLSSVHLMNCISLSFVGLNLLTCILFINLVLLGEILYWLVNIIFEARESGSVWYTYISYTCLSSSKLIGGTLYFCRKMKYF